MISVIIPTLNERKTLPALLERLSAEPDAHEVIVIDGDLGPLPAPLCEATRLDACEMVRAPAPGVLSYAADIGARVEAGEVIVWLTDPAVEDPDAGRQAIRAGTDGLLLSRLDRRFVLPGANLAKIVGKEPLPEREGAYLLSD